MHIVRMSGEKRKLIGFWLVLLNWDYGEVNACEHCLVGRRSWQR